MSSELVATPAHILKNAAATLTATVYVDGVATDPGTVTLGVVDATGATVVAAETATTVGATGVRTYALAGQADTQQLTVTWSSSVFGDLTSEHEVVGGFLFSVRETRAFDDGALTNTVTYPAADIEAARARITDEFEEICGVSFVPRYERVVLNGDDSELYSGFYDDDYGRVALTLVKRAGRPALRVAGLRAVETRAPGASGWTALSSDDLADIQVDPWGYMVRESRGLWPFGRRNIRVAFEHGYAAAPGAIRRAALMLARYQLVPSNVSVRAISEATGAGTIQYAVANAGLDRHYGIPEVDAALNRYSERAPVIG